MAPQKKRARSKSGSPPSADARSVAQSADGDGISSGSNELMAALRLITQSAQTATTSSCSDPGKEILGLLKLGNGQLSAPSDESRQNPIMVVVVQQTVNDNSYRQNINMPNATNSSVTINAASTTSGQTLVTDPLLLRIATIEAQLKQTQGQLKQTQESYRNWLQHTTGQRQSEWYIVGLSLKLFSKHSKAHPQHRLNIHALILYELLQAKPKQLSAATLLAEQVKQLKVYLANKKLDDYLHDYNSTWKETLTLLFSATEEYHFSHRLGFVPSSQDSLNVSTSQAVALSSVSSSPDSQTNFSAFQGREHTSETGGNVHAHQVTGLQLKKTVEYYQSDGCLRTLCEDDKVLAKDIATRKGIYEGATKKFGLMFFGRNVAFDRFDDEFLSYFSFHNPTSRSFAEHDGQVDS
jgi:hypothetical protein